MSKFYVTVPTSTSLIIETTIPADIPSFTICPYPGVNYTAAEELISEKRAEDRSRALTGWMPKVNLKNIINNVVPLLSITDNDTTQILAYLEATTIPLWNTLSLCYIVSNYEKVSCRFPADARESIISSY